MVIGMEQYYWRNLRGIVQKDGVKYNSIVMVGSLPDGVE